jgi:hypothetical protein
VGTMDEGQGQELVAAGRGLARGGGRHAALEFQGLAAVPAEADRHPRVHGICGDWAARGVSHRHPRARARLAEGLGGAGVERDHHPTQARGALLAL